MSDSLRKRVAIILFRAQEVVRSELRGVKPRTYETVSSSEQQEYLEAADSLIKKGMHDKRRDSES